MKRKDVPDGAFFRYLPGQTLQGSPVRGYFWMPAHAREVRPWGASTKYTGLTAHDPGEMWRMATPHKDAAVQMGTKAEDLGVALVNFPEGDDIVIAPVAQAVTIGPGAPRVIPEYPHDCPKCSGKACAYVGWNVAVLCNRTTCDAYDSARLGKVYHLSVGDTVPWS